MKSFSYISFLALLLTMLLFAQSNPAIYPDQPNAPPIARTPQAEATAPVSESARALKAKFAPAVAYASGAYAASSVAVADVNGDGFPDLVVANRCQSSTTCDSTGVVSVLLGNDDGTFQAPLTYSSGGVQPYSVAIADVNGDGHPDLVVANSCQSNGTCGDGKTPGAVSVLLGNGDGTFQAPVSYSSGGVYAQSVAIADVNGDGHPDLVVASQCPIGECDGEVPGVVSVLLGNGDGTFQSAVSYSAGGDYASSVAIGDVNGDGHPDLVVTTEGWCQSYPSCVSVLLGNGDGTFQPAVSYSSGGYGAWSVAIGDVNGDGHPDLVVANECQDASGECPSGSVSVLLGNGDGTFQGAVSYATRGSGSESVAVADVNGDGKPDLLVANPCTHRKCVNGSVSVLLGNGDGTFQAAVMENSGGDFANSIAVADVNADGRPDLVVANECANGNCANGSVSVLLNLTQFTSTTKVTSSLNPSQVNQSVTFTATITSTGPIPDGEVVTFYDGVTELGTGTTTSGIVTLTTSFSSPGRYAIKATYPGDAFHKASSGKVRQVVNRGAANPVFAGASPTLAPASKTGMGCWSSIELYTSGSPSFITDSVTFTAQVNQTMYCHGHYTGTCQGSVAFYDFRNVIGTSRVTDCQASIETDSLKLGRHHISATFNPLPPWPSSSAHLTQVVDKFPTVTALASSPNPSSYGQTAIFTATAVSNPNAPTPTGRIRFMNGANWMGSTIVDYNGVATLATNNLALGTNSITAQYLGDGFNLPSTSTVLSQVVNPAATTTVITSSVNPSRSGQNVTFRAKVTPAKPTAGPHIVRPTGTVTFTAGVTTLGTVALTGIHASISTNALPVGSTTITATYNGSADFIGSSASLTQTIRP